MIHLYISHAAADKKSLDTLLQWIKPLEDKYFLRVWYEHPPPPAQPWPFVWQLLAIIFLYRPSKPKFPYPEELPEQLNKGHIYLFLTSYSSLVTPHINDLEIPTAVDRSVKLGPELVRIFPILVSPSEWKKQSRLSGFKPMGPENSLAKSNPPEEGYQKIIENLEQVILELRQNWMEEYRRSGLPTDEFHRLPSNIDANDQITPLPGWAGWVILFTILYVVTAVYTTYCSPRMYYKYKPQIAPYESKPVPLFRENPYRPPDTTGIPPSDEKPK